MSKNFYLKILSKKKNIENFYKRIILLTEREHIFKILKILKSRLSEKNDPFGVEYSMIYNAANYKEIYLESEIEFFAKNVFMQCGISIENSENDQNCQIGDFVGRFTNDFLESYLPLPNGEEVVIVAVDEDVEKSVLSRLKARGFKNLIPL